MLCELYVDSVVLAFNCKSYPMIMRDEKSFSLQFCVIHWNTCDVAITIVGEHHSIVVALRRPAPCIEPITKLAQKSSEGMSDVDTQILWSLISCFPWQFKR